MTATTRQPFARLQQLAAAAAFTAGAVIALVAPAPAPAAAAPLAHAAFSLSPQSGPPGTTITVKGTGYDLNTPIYAFLYQGTNRVSTVQATADSAGLIQISLPVPGGVAAGDWKVATTPVYRGQDISGQAYFLMSRGLGNAFKVTAAPTTVAILPPAPALGPVPFGGNCRGAGCAHPDLTAYGGSGPAGTTARSVHVQYNAAQYLWVTQLPPSTSVSTLLNRCQNGAAARGRLVLLDDEPWYYFFTGRYATFGCAR